MTTGRGFKIYTSRYTYKALSAFDGVKVQISIGGPKWDTGYHIHIMKMLQPRYGVKWDEFFREKYEAYLDSVGVDEIRRMFNRISSSYGNKDLVLLCHENVAQGKTCHRRYFAEWWEKHTGEKIEEIELMQYNFTEPDKPEKPEKKPFVQAMLF